MHKYLLRVTRENVNALKQLQLMITPNAAVSHNQLLLYSLSAVIVIKWCHFTDASQQWKIF